MEPLELFQWRSSIAHSGPIFLLTFVVSLALFAILIARRFIRTNSEDEIFSATDSILLLCFVSLPFLSVGINASVSYVVRNQGGIDADTTFFTALGAFHFSSATALFGILLFLAATLVQYVIRAWRRRSMQKPY